VFVGGNGKRGPTSRFICFFGDAGESETLAFSIARHGAAISPIGPQTEWVFLEAINTLKIPDAWISEDFQHVIEHLKSDGYCLLQDEPIDSVGLFVPPPQSPE
jgi:hypothetical protein